MGSYASFWVGSIDTKNKLKSQIKRREELNKKRYNESIRKREKDLKDHYQDKSLTFNLGDIYNINSTEGFITHKSLGNIERR